MTAEAINAAHTFVHYHCSCPDVNRSLSSLTLKENEAKNNDKKIVGDRDDDNNTELNKNREYANTTKEDALFPLDAYSPRTVFSTFALSKLYFCEDCHQIRCPRCVQEEIVCYYCPNCLFEVPTASVKSERNRCARNCFQCPICQNTLTVVASTEPPPVTPATAVPPRLLPNAAPAPSPPVPTPQPTGAPYFLLCGVCRWDSQEINMTFEKATGLALQLQKTEDEKPDVKEFEHLKEHFEKHLRTNAPSTTLSSHLFLFPGLNGFSSRYGSSGSTQNQPKSDDVAPYEAAVKVIEEEGLIEELKKLDNPNAVTTLTQRLDQLSDQPYKVEKLQPQRIHLRTKRVKRCRTCHHILIKPEQKAQAIKFKIKLVALNYIPKITIAKLPKLTVNQKTHVILKFSNPLDVEVDIKLTTKEKDAYGTITMPTSEFAISPYNEVWEYDDEDFGTDNRLPSRGRHSQAASTHGTEGIFEKKGSYTSIILEVTPLVEMDEFRFPLLVTYTYKATIEISTQDDTKLDKLSTNKSDDVDKTDTDIDTSTATAETSAITPSTNADTDNEPEAILTKEITKSLSFCTIIGLGAVAKVSSAPPTSSSSKTPTGVGSSSNT